MRVVEGGGVRILGCQAVVVGYVRVIHAFLPLLERAPDPRIVNVSSGLGSFALFHDPGRIESRIGTPLYAAAKSAINMLTARYARLLSGVRINAADPGMTARDSRFSGRKRWHRVCRAGHGPASSHLWASLVDGDTDRPILCRRGR